MAFIYLDKFNTRRFIDNVWLKEKLVNMTGLENNENVEANFEATTDSEVADIKVFFEKIGKGIATALATTKVVNT